MKKEEIKLPAHLQEIVDKLASKGITTMDQIQVVVEDVTPEGYGPEED